MKNKNVWAVQERLSAADAGVFCVFVFYVYISVTEMISVTALAMIVGYMLWMYVTSTPRLIRDALPPGARAHAWSPQRAPYVGYFGPHVRFGVQVVPVGPTKQNA